MLPKGSDSSRLQVMQVARMPSSSYKMLIEEEKISGDVDGELAVLQACYKLLNTERYRFVIYSWGYGIELADLFGKPLPYVYSDLPRRIKEALLYDDRVQDVVNFRISHKKNDVTAVFDVVTQAGVLEFSKEVRIA